jgi:hypothetical protein
MAHAVRLHRVAGPSPQLVVLLLRLSGPVVDAVLRKSRHVDHDERNDRRDNKKIVMTIATSNTSEEPTFRRFRRGRLPADDGRARECKTELPRAHAVLFGVVQEHVDITRYMAEDSQQQRNLPTVMNTMIGCVLHQLP